MEYCGLRYVVSMNASCAKYEFEWDHRTRGPTSQQYNWAILTVLSMLTFYIIASALRLAHISILYPVCCLTVWPGRDNVIEFDQQSDWAWWELRKTLSQTWNIRREGGRWENGAESFPGYSNWEGIRMPLLSLLTPPTTIKKLKPKLFFVIQDETM